MSGWLSSVLSICLFRQKKSLLQCRESTLILQHINYEPGLSFCAWLYNCFHAAEDTFLSAIINYTNSSTVHFKLSPTYVLYMACRFVLSPSYRPDMSPSERTHKVIAIVNKMVSMMEGVIQVSNTTFQINVCNILYAVHIVLNSHFPCVFCYFSFFSP